MGVNSEDARAVRNREWGKIGPDFVVPASAGIRRIPDRIKPGLTIHTNVT